MEKKAHKKPRKRIEPKAIVSLQEVQDAVKVLKGVRTFRQFTERAGHKRISAGQSRLISVLRWGMEHKFICIKFTPN